MLAAGQSTPIDIPPNSQGTISLSVELALTNLSPELRNLLLFNDTVLDLSLRAEAGVGDLLSAKVEGEASIPWGAPLYGLTVSSPSASLYNSSCLLIQVPLGFENHSPYIDLGTTASLTLLNASTLQPVGMGVLPITVSSGEAFEGLATLYVNIDEEFLETLVFNDVELQYILVAEVEVEGFQASMNSPVSYSWGAPLSDFQAGTPSLTSHNSGHFKVSTPLSFRNRSPIRVEGSLTMRVYDGENLIAQGAPLELGIEPGESFSGELEAYVAISDIHPGTFKVVVEASTDYGSFTQEVVLNV